MSRKTAVHTMSSPLPVGGGGGPLRSKRHSSVNEDSSKEPNNDDLPLAIQIFLWRQTRSGALKQNQHTEAGLVFFGNQYQLGLANP